MIAIMTAQIQSSEQMGFQDSVVKKHPDVAMQEVSGPSQPLNASGFQYVQQPARGQEPAASEHQPAVQEQADVPLGPLQELVASDDEVVIDGVRIAMESTLATMRAATCTEWWKAPRFFQVD